MKDKIIKTEYPTLLENRLEGYRHMLTVLIAHLDNRGLLHKGELQADCRRAVIGTQLGAQALQDVDEVFAFADEWIESLKNVELRR